MKVDFQPAPKRYRFTPINLMDSESTKNPPLMTNYHPDPKLKLLAKLADAKENFGREIRVFETSKTSSANNNVSNTEEEDDFYEFTAEDYYRVMATKKEDKFLKTRKLREAEEAARRSKLTKAVIRVRFPDNHTFEAVFHPSETLQSLVELLMKVINHPEVPFYIFTTPPKKKVQDTTQDFYSAGFVPGAIVYFAYDLPEGGSSVSEQFLKDEVMDLKGLELTPEQAKSVVSGQADTAVPETSVPERKAADKKSVKPKWLKM